MEEEKLTAYYNELTRKGEGAAKFKQGLGFSSQSSDSSNPTKGSALPSSSTFLSNFVRASSPAKETDIQKKIQLENVQNKLKKKQNSEAISRVSDKRSPTRDRDRDRDRDRERRIERRRSRSRSRDRSDSRRRDRSSSRERGRDRERKSERRRGSRSRSLSNEERRRYRSSSRDRGGGRDRDRERRIERKRRRSRSRSSNSDEERRRGRSSRENRSRRRSRSSSPGDRRLEKGRDDGRKRRGDGKNDKDKSGGVDYSRLIKGYDEMTPAEKVKAKMKLQLAQTVEKDTTKGMGAGWERFEFNKDAPLDDEEMEVVEDDAKLVKNIGQSFRFSTVEARREEQIKAAHDDAMFGAPAQLASHSEKEVQESILENDEEESKESDRGVNLISEKVLAKQNGSWRDRARKLKDG